MPMESQQLLEVGDTAPAFTLPDHTGKVRTLSDYKGTWIILYFYPKDDTPGCTKEACAIRDVFEDFARLGVTVLGVSTDSPESHKAFKEKYGLPFTLLSDETGKMIATYGAQEAQGGFPMKHTGTARITYLIDPELTITKVYEAVDPANHALELLAELEGILQQ